MFTVEIVSLGHFLWVSFPVFMESGEEQHFLRGKPAFQAQTLFQAPQTGNALSPIYVFHPVPRKHECRKTGMHVHGCVSVTTHTHTRAKQRQAGRLITDKWGKTSQSAVIAPVFTSCNRPCCKKKTTQTGSSSTWNPPNWPPPHSSLKAFFPRPVNTGDKRDLKRELGGDLLSLFLPAALRSFLITSRSDY